jgi:hypothetical protein
MGLSPSEENKKHMKPLTVKTAVTETEIEAHVAAHNSFFRSAGLTLDDLSTYTPLADIARAALSASEGHIPVAEALAIMRRAITGIRALHAAMDAENAA